MKEWKFEYMNEGQIAEIDKLWKDGHADALIAYGLECGNAGAKGYASGLAKGALLAVAKVVVVAGGMYFGRKLHHKVLEEKRKIKEVYEKDVDAEN